jgi:hypothetical protein
MATADSQAHIEMLELFWKWNTRGGHFIKLGAVFPH